MFTEEDFQLPLEKQLRMRVISQEIDECTDVAALQENLKECASSLMKYQHLLAQTLKKQLLSELESHNSEIYKIVTEAINQDNDTSRSEEG